MTERIKTQIATSDETSITVRGHDLVDGIMGHYGFTEFMYFLICRRFPTPGETRLLDACLVTLMEHGLTPTALVTRLVADNVPGETQVAMAAGLLAVGSVFVGTMEGCGEILKRGIDQGGDLEAYCRDTVADFRARKKAMPGFGHPIHKPDDPRPPRLFQIAAECGVKGDYIALLKRLGAELDRQAGRHLTINATGAIAALLLEIGLPPQIMRAIAVVSRAGGLPGHILEEHETHSGRYIWKLVEHSIPYEEPSHEK
ncbi:MAG TPA: citryl-CoA lyase [Stellaceae bacterium]|jgi:citrate synthase|nr:citryl-CoA lyase [Stellaceae bacterium]